MNSASQILAQRSLRFLACHVEDLIGSVGNVRNKNDQIKQFKRKKRKTHRHLVVQTPTKSTDETKEKTAVQRLIDACEAQMQRGLNFMSTNKNKASVKVFSLQGPFCAVIPSTNKYKAKLVKQGIDPHKIRGVDLKACATYGTSHSAEGLDILLPVDRRLIFIDAKMPTAAGTPLRPVLDDVLLSGGQWLIVTNPQQLFKTLKNGRIGQPIPRQTCVRGIDTTLNNLKVLPNTQEQDFIEK